MSIDEKEICKSVEERVVEYFKDLKKIQIYESKLKYYKENSSILVGEKYEIEIVNVKKKIAELEFKDKLIEEEINNFSEEEKELLKLKYVKNLSTVKICRELYMCNKTYYKVKKNIFKQLSSVVL